MTECGGATSVLTVYPPVPSDVVPCVHFLDNKLKVKYRLHVGKSIFKKNKMFLIKKV